MPEPSHTSTDEWQSFEVRMRRRRAERCVLRAEVAWQAGFEDEAREALAEASRLDATVPGLFELQQQLARSPYTPPPSRGSWTKRRVLISVAAGATLMLGAALAWNMAVPAPDTAEVTAPAPVRQGMEVPAPRDVVTIRHTDIVAAVVNPPVALDTRQAKRDEPPPAPRMDVPVQADAPSRPAPAAAPVPAAAVLTAPDIPLEALELPASLVTSTPSTPPAAVPAMRTPEPNPPEPEPAARTASAPPLPPVDERARVRSVLSRYEAAYSGLDASAAHAVWPGVDRQALARAFNGLESQDLSLGRCDVTVEGTIARAVCVGSATWTPKVGSGRTESRRWAFDLKNASGLWQIVRAEVR